MPGFPYLYHVQEIEEKPSSNALSIPDTFSELQPPPGYEIVPSQRAIQLVAYLKSLKLDYELPEAKFYVEPESVAQVEETKEKD